MTARSSPAAGSAGDPSLLPGAPLRLRGLLRWLAEDDTAGWLRGYLIAAILVAGATGARALLGLIFEGLTPTFVIFLGASVATAFLAGTGPALAATAASAVIANLYFVGKPGAFEFDSADLVVLAAFVVEGGVIAVFGGRMRRLLRRLIEREAEISDLYAGALAKEHELLRANEALQLLADAGVALNQSLDLQRTMTALAGLVVPRFADACFVDLLEDGKLRRVARASADARLAEAVEAFEAAGAAQELRAAIANAVRGGSAWFVPVISDEMLRRLSGTPALAEIARRVEARSIIVAPIESRDGLFGAMTFLRVGGSRHFDGRDVELARQVGARAAIAIDHARLYDEARRANDAKDEFLGFISHELRTPITVIHGGAHVLRTRRAELDPDVADGILADVEREAERLSRMLENLLALSRAELDRDVPVEPVLLQRLIPRLVAGLDPGNGCTVDVRVETSPPPVAGDPGYLEHVLRNLIQNAAKYSPPGTTIEVVVAGDASGGTVSVLDRGPGVPPEDIDRIFERFYRSSRTAGLAPGAGLGLAVCRRLIEGMGGTIRAELRQEGGLAVTFWLPAFADPGDDDER
ncbi:ATP-binding protein [Tepidiforma sp.]|uniref:GAF domain-containing sensor histidine kinase n=1 Tax=Tepidiforma sp. TaxID=2682230 RepID=UPI0026065E06|nr:ATP-binding protein [Tepidiforma sp.]MCX7617412.1 ATP-binding protein [Tepidiforma sp.]